MILTKSDKELLQKLEENGIAFQISRFDGGYDNLGIDELTKFVENPAAWNAAEMKMPLDLFQKISQWMDSEKGQPCCTGLTKSGDKCKNSLNYQTWIDPFFSEFKFGIDDRCRLHKDQVVNIPIVVKYQEKDKIGEL